jgi:hypothetical protein
MSSFAAGMQPRRVDGASQVRWECGCRQPPVLLATYGANGLIHIKSRDRYWHVRGSVQTVCPRCGGEHRLDLGQDSSAQGEQ